MTRKHPTVHRIVRRLRPSPERIAAAAAVQDPNPLLQLRAAQMTGMRPAAEPCSPCAA